MSPHLRTAQEVAELLGYSVEHVWELARTGKIPCYRMSKKSYRFDLEEIADWLERHRQEAPTDV